MEEGKKWRKQVYYDEDPFSTPCEKYWKKSNAAIFPRSSFEIVTSGAVTAFILGRPHGR